MLTKNHKFQVLKIKLENIERKLKQTISLSKYQQQENNLICLPTIEAETLVSVWFLLRERDTDSVREKRHTREGAVGVWERGVYI